MCMCVYAGMCVGICVSVCMYMCVGKDPFHFSLPSNETEKPHSWIGSAPGSG